MHLGDNPKDSPIGGRVKETEGDEERVVKHIAAVDNWSLTPLESQVATQSYT